MVGSVADPSARCAQVARCQAAVMLWLSPSQGRRQASLVHHASRSRGGGRRLVAALHGAHLAEHGLLQCRARGAVHSVRLHRHAQRDLQAKRLRVGKAR